MALWVFELQGLLFKLFDEIYEITFRKSVDVELTFLGVLFCCMHVGTKTLDELKSVAVV